MNLELDLQAIRESLEEQRKQLNDQISQEETALTPKMSQNPDRSSLALEYATHERNLAFHETHTLQLAQIEAALKRLDEETYGLCEDCRKTINPARLEALPYTTVCIACQSKRELRG